MIQYNAALVYRGESGALNKHIADAFGIMVKQMYENETAEDTDWLIGEGCLLPGVKGVALRSMKSPGTAYSDPRFVSLLHPLTHLPYPFPPPSAYLLPTSRTPSLGHRPPTGPHLQDPRPDADPRRLHPRPRLRRRAHLLWHPQPRLLPRCRRVRRIYVGQGWADLVEGCVGGRADPHELHVCVVCGCHGRCGGGVVRGGGGAGGEGRVEESRG